MASRKARFTATPVFEIGSWLVQPARNRISDRTTTRRLEPQVMDLLVFLAHTGGRVVSKDEIIDAVWEGRFIAETTLTRSVADLRRALGDNQTAPAYIETIPKRGYRLVASVSVPRQGEGARVSDLLASERRRRFVGRDREIEIFRSALLAEQPPFVAWHIHGPGGVGKTTLLEEFARIAQAEGRAAVRIDGRNIEASPLGFLVALGDALGAERCDLAIVIERWPVGGVLFVDTYEWLSPIDDWLRSTLLPQLPARTLVVIAGRNKTWAAWQTSVDWAALTRVQPLGNLGPEDSRTYLTRCGVPVAHHDSALAFTRGHPLALSLTAAVVTRGEPVPVDRLETEPEIAQRLIEKFVQDVPSRDHRLALHACVTARALTEPDLAAALDRRDVRDLFEWLGGLSFVEQGPYGLFPHDLARDVVYMDFRWRDPDAAYRVTERLITHLYMRLERSRGLDQLRIWFDVIYPQRYNPNLRPYLEWGAFGTAYAETASAGEHGPIVEMIERHEGRGSAAIAEYWLQRQPDAFFSIRSVAGDLIGCVAHLRLEAITPDDLAADPAVAPALAHVERHGRRNPGEHVTYCRFLLDRERYQVPVLAPIAASCSQNWTAANLAWCFIAVADPDAFEPLFSELHVWRTRDADFESGGRHYGVFAHDWRVENAGAWLRLKAERAWRIESVPAAHQMPALSIPAESEGDPSGSRTTS